jgi:hypothetical protein
MKKNLLSILTALALLFISNLSAQTFTFETGSDTEGWTESYGGDISQGTEDGRGCLIQGNNGGAAANNRTIIFNETSPNGIDTGNGYLKLVLKNTTASGIAFRINAYNSYDGSGGNNWTPNHVISAGDTEFKTYYVAISPFGGFWEAGNEKLQLQLQFRDNSGSPTLLDGNIYIDEIEFFTVPATYSEFTRDPGFEDYDANVTAGSGWDPDTKGFGTAALSTADFHTGATSMAYTFTGAQSGWWAVNNTSAKTYDPGYGPGTKITSTVWVKTNVAQEYKFFIGYLLDDAPKGGYSQTIDSGDATTWTQLTYTYTLPADVSFTTAKTRLSLPTTGAGFDNGDIVYVDDVVTTFTTEVALSNENNVLEGITVYPNPTKDNVKISAPIGSKISFTNLTGANVKQVSATSDLTQISVADLASGIYVLSIVSEGKSFVTKLVIQ